MSRLAPALALLALLAAPATACPCFRGAGVAHPLESRAPVGPAPLQAVAAPAVTVALAAQANSLRTFEKEPLVVAAPTHAGANYRVMDRIGAAYSSQVKSLITLARAIRTEIEREQSRVSGMSPTMASDKCCICFD